MRSAEALRPNAPRRQLGVLQEIGSIHRHAIGMSSLLRKSKRLCMHETDGLPGMLGRLNKTRQVGECASTLQGWAPALSE